VTAEIRFTPRDTGGDLVGDGLFGHAEAHGDFALREAFDFVEKDDFTAAFGQLGQGAAEQPALFLAGQQLRRIRPLVYEDGRVAATTHRYKRRGAFAAVPVEREIAGNLEEKSLGGADRLSSVKPPQAQIGFLHDILDITHGGEGTPQVGLELPIVRKHFLGKPTGLLGVGRHRVGRKRYETFDQSKRGAQASAFNRGSAARWRWSRFRGDAEPVAEESSGADVVEGGVRRAPSGACGPMRQNKQDAERDRGHHEEVDGDELVRMVATKCSPRLRGRPALALWEILSDGRGGHVEPEFRQFRPNLRTALIGISLPHPAD
jgi:hypothetical protein